MSWGTPNHAPSPNRRPRLPLGVAGEFGHHFCAPLSSSAAVGEAPRSAMRIQSAFFLSGITAAFVVMAACAADHSYYELFQDALAKQQSVVVEGVSLVDTNNSGPGITNAPLSFGKFRKGEIDGIRLGMTMSEVVGAWGKPTRLFSRCGIGPRFCYRPGRTVGDVALFFKEDRLVLISIVGETAKHLSFDDGLNGQHGRADFERILGASVIRDADQPADQIAYRTGGVRIDFLFGPERAPLGPEHLCWAAIRNEVEAKGEQDAPPSGGSALPSTSSGASENRHR